MQFTGERYVPTLEAPFIGYEHLHRYYYAAELCRGLAVLDIASGEGYGSAILARRASSVTGVDLSLEAVEHARKKYPDVSFLEGDVSNIPIAGGGIFDAIISFETIEHIDEDEQCKFLGEVKRLLAPGGIFILSTPDKRLYSDLPMSKNEFHQKEFYAEEFVGFLKGYFKEVRLYGQKVRAVSYLRPQDPLGGKLSEHRIRWDGSRFVEDAPVSDDVYCLAICSDTPVALPGASILIDSSERIFQVQAEAACDLGTRIKTLELNLSREREAGEGLAAQVSAEKIKNKALEAHLREEKIVRGNLLSEFSIEKAKTADFHKRLEEIEFSVSYRAIRRLRNVKALMAAYLFLRPLLKFFWQIYWKIEIGGISAFRKESEESPLDMEEDSMLIPIFPEKDAPAAELAVKAIAFYLPQYHRIPENDAWWGEGFSEWVNVKKARPLLPGQYQPQEPHKDVGYYDLSDASVMERQARLAREAGIFGFCFYTYWFAGKKLLEMPVNRFLNTGKPDLPFCLCWANENWSRRWDGKDSEILIAQDHSEKHDLDFIRDVLPAFRDRRYIRTGNRPLFLVYRPALLPNARETFRRWRDVCRREGIGEIHLVGVASFKMNDPASMGLDAVAEFPPNEAGVPPLEKDKTSELPKFEGNAYDYRRVRQNFLNHRNRAYPVYRGVTPSWDNTARRGGQGNVLVGSSPEAYYSWLKKAADLTLVERKKEDRFLFINAWNEWAEGCHLEPDARHGYAWLNATRRALR